MYLKLGQDYFISNADIGSLVCVKITNSYYNSLEEHKNCIILGFKYYKNNTAASHMVLLNPMSIQNFVRIDYDKIIVEIKFLSRLKGRF